MSAPTRPPQRKGLAQQSFGDLARSLFVLLLAIGAIWGVGSLFTEEQQRRVRPVDYAGRLAAAQEAADYQVLAPAGLPEGWVPTSVDVQRGGGTVHWHLGFLTPQREYVGLEQAGLRSAGMARSHVADLRRVGRVSVSGQPWRLYRGSVDTALLRRGPEAVTVVVGTASVAVLADFAGSLTPAP